MLIVLVTFIFSEFNLEHVTTLLLVEYVNLSSTVVP